MLTTQIIKEYAYTLGFDTVRITTAEAFPEAEQVIKERIAQGLMDGLPWFTSERAEVSCHPNALLPEAQSIIALGMCYLSEQPDESKEGELRGRISRYAWGDDYHDLIKPKLQQFSTWLHDYAKHESGETLETRLFVDTGRMVDRAVAQRAGLGWYGKNTNILTKGWGSWLFLAEIVTNLSLQADKPLKTNCGSCELCLHACPTGALPNAYELDTPRCISFLTIELRGSIPIELRPLMGNLIFGCDICQEVCPVNKSAERRLMLYPQSGPKQSGLKQGESSDWPSSTLQAQTGYQGKPKTSSGSAPGRPTQPGMIPLPVRQIQGQEGSTQAFQGHAAFQPRPQVGTSPELIPLLSLTEEEFRERFRRSPIKRTKRRGLLRNVCVALGNSGDLQAVPALIQALHDDEALIRGHAAWALGRLGGTRAIQALQEAKVAEDDREVQQEILYALSLT